MKPFLRTLLLAACAAASAHAGEDSPVSRIGFGSCADQKRPQPVWDAINKLDPQLFILAGDNVYADSADPAVLNASYAKLSAVPGFLELHGACPVVATWDDHDFGANDAGAEWKGKEAAKQAFMDFFHTPAASPVRSRGGVYDAHVFGPPGRRVQVILLDTRWFRGPLTKMPPDEVKAMKARDGAWNGPYVADENNASTMLGDEQWAWLDEQFRVPAEIRLLVSSIQVVADQHGWEKWGNLPRERRRLLEMIRDRAKGVIILSGDRHTADISVLPPGADGGPDYPLYDITSSGLNQNGFSREENRWRAGHEASFGKPNFGWITIGWDEKDIPVRMEIRDADGNVVREARTTLAELSR